MKIIVTAASKFVLSPKTILDYLKKRRRDDGYLSDSVLKKMAQEIYEVARREEREMGEKYMSIEDIDIINLFDGSDDPFHTLGHVWSGAVDPEDLDNWDGDAQYVPSLIEQYMS